MRENPGNNYAIISLVLGIIGLLTGYWFGLGCILGIVGLIFAVISGNNDQAVGLPMSGMCVAGLVMSIIAIINGASCLLCTTCGCFMS